MTETEKLLKQMLELEKRIEALEEKTWLPIQWKCKLEGCDNRYYHDHVIIHNDGSVDFQWGNR